MHVEQVPEVFRRLSVRTVWRDHMALLAQNTWNSTVVTSLGEIKSHGGLNLSSFEYIKSKSADT